MADIIDEIIRREGGDKETNDPTDRGGRTKYGISEVHNPEAWADGDVDYQEARSIYERKYIVGPRFNRVKNDKLRELLIDYGVNSGPQLAIQKLQEILKVKTDGILGPKTLAAIEAQEPRRLTNQLALARIKMMGRIAKKDPSQLKYINGWLDRAGSFIE